PATVTPTTLPAARGAAVTASTAATAALAPPPPGPRAWSYTGHTGPQAWATLTPANALCARGTRQSPIDIRNGLKVDQDALGIDYKLSYFNILDNGRTIRVGYGRGSTLSVMGRRYELQHADFHSPAEIRVEGRSFEMSMQLLHRDAEGRLAILVVLLREGRANPLIQTLWNNLPLERDDEYTAQTPIQMADVLPAQRGYYAFMGSLTTPPCSEGVLWLVLKEPVELSREQIDIFRRYHDDNARPLQPANARIVKESR
ncbi:MAG: carbonic anhydrase family protein, partial [Candidatus Dactylopiibacterium sp.]|nr:carbonic anhydrase family protein [Candidatus Dactylopiibacterium sp.]